MEQESAYQDYTFDTCARCKYTCMYAPNPRVCASRRYFSLNRHIAKASHNVTWMLHVSWWRVYPYIYICSQLPVYARASINSTRNMRLVKPAYKPNVFFYIEWLLLVSSEPELIFQLFHNKTLHHWASRITFETVVIIFYACENKSIKPTQESVFRISRNTLRFFCRSVHIDSRVTSIYWNRRRHFFYMAQSSTYYRGDSAFSKRQFFFFFWKLTWKSIMARDKIIFFLENGVLWIYKIYKIQWIPDGWMGRFRNLIIIVFQWWGILVSTTFLYNYLSIVLYDLSVMD